MLELSRVHMLARKLTIFYTTIRKEIPSAMSKFFYLAIMLLIFLPYVRVVPSSYVGQKTDNSEENVWRIFQVLHLYSGIFLYMKVNPLKPELNSI